MSTTGRYGDEQSRQEVRSWIDRCGMVEGVGAIMVLRWCEHKRTEYYLTQLHMVNKDEVITLTPRVCAFGRDGVMVATADTCARLLIPKPEVVRPVLEGHHYVHEVLYTPPPHARPSHVHAANPDPTMTRFLEHLKQQTAVCP